MSTTLPTIGHFIGGRHITPSEGRASEVFNPAVGAATARVALADEAALEQAVAAAHAAFPAWAATSPLRRARIMFKYKELLEKNADRLARLITAEHGKVFTDAKGEVQRGIEVVEFACGIPQLLKGEITEQVANGIDAWTVRQPLGVCAGITPFNFPVMVPMWMFPMALACGNTFILKPSERDPSAALLLAELLQEAGLPDGVFNVLQGDKQAVDGLLQHPKVKAISFVGSTPVAREIHRKGTSHGKRVQAAGGAKNFIVLMPDADVERTVEAVKDGAFGCAGERCMAGSTAVAVGDAGERLLPALADLVKSMKTGPTDVRESQPDMGAVISAEHRSRVSGLIDAGERAGAKILADGRTTRVDDAPEGFFLGPTLIDQVDANNPLMETEVFGPVLAVMRAKSLDEAIAAANRQAFGNGAAIFTNSGKAAREFRRNVSAGMVGINVGVPAPLAYFPFSGWNDSFFGDLHIQGKEGVEFYTQRKTTTTRWFGYGDGEIWAK